MSSCYGENIKLSVFGQSHSPAVGMTLDGVPAGFRLDGEALYAFLLRRAPGKSALTSPRSEDDRPEFICGLNKGLTCGTPLTAIIQNRDIRPGDYLPYRLTPRPGHADYTQLKKYGSTADLSGGGHASGRLTAPLCLAGGICIQLLAQQGIKIISRIASIGEVKDTSPLTSSTAEKSFPACDDEAAEKMLERIAFAAAQGDSVGGTVECAVLGLPAGVGDPMFGGMENKIAAAVFAIPAVKGIEFGAGFAAAEMAGSSCNDRFFAKDGRVETVTNNCGGILGGITDGMPMVFRVAFKPTPSIASAQSSLNLETMEAETIEIGGRHDPCVVPRAVPCVEAVAALAVYDALLGSRICGGISDGDK